MANPSFVRVVAGGADYPDALAYSARFTMRRTDKLRYPTEK